MTTPDTTDEHSSEPVNSPAAHLPNCSKDPSPQLVCLNQDPPSAPVAQPLLLALYLQRNQPSALFTALFLALTSLKGVAALLPLPVWSRAADSSQPPVSRLGDVTGRASLFHTMNPLLQPHQ